MYRVILALLVSAPSLAAQAEAFTPTKDGVSPLGTRAACDLPAGEHIRNVGGSDGAGLCVPTSIVHAAKWQNIPGMYGYRAWCERRPGGSWPQKTDKDIAAYCRDKGIPSPVYIQHTGGDDEFLELAIKTGRMPGITYDGRDDFYKSRIAHMVNLSHLDAREGSIIDNNRPTVFVWMTPPELLSRWRGSDGGWAFVWLAPPPPPHTKAAVTHPAAGLPDRPGEWVPTIDGREFGFWVGVGKERKCIAYLKANGRVVSVALDGAITDVEIPPPAPLPGNRIPAPAIVPFAPATVFPVCPGGNCPPGRTVFGQLPPGVPDGGVDAAKIHKGTSRYQMNGVEITRDEAKRIMAGQLIDDSGRWNLTSVGDPAFLARVSADVAQFPETVKSKLHVQVYPPGDWAVRHFNLPAGVSLRTSGLGGASTRTVGVIPPADYSATRLAELLASPDGPLAVPVVPPAPQPKPLPPKIEPQPIEPAPKQPDPQPAPVEPQPMNRLDVIAAVILAVLALVGIFYRRK